MTDQLENTEDAAAPAGPVLLARGRYAISEMPDGALVITRAGPICATCEACGCGGQGEPLVIPALLASVIKAHSEGKRPAAAQVRKLTRMALGALAGRGPALEGGGDDDNS